MQKDFCTKKGRNLAILISSSNFEFKKVIYWLGHSVPIKSSTVNWGSRDTFALATINSYLVKKYNIVS